jgi:hypothetical protein
MSNQLFLWIASSISCTSSPAHLLMTSLPITYHQPPNPSHNLQHVFKFRITDASPKFPELADFQRVYEEKELIEAENEARERKKIQKPPGRRISDFAQQMKEEKEPLNHYDREAIIAVEQGGQEYLCSVTSNAFRVDEVDPNAIVHSRKKPVPQFVQFVAVVRSDSIQLTPVTGNVYEAKRRPSTSGRRNLDRRQYDGEREKKVGNEMLRLLGAHRKLEVYDKEANKYSAFGSAEDISENNLDDIHRRIDIDTNDLDLDPGQGMDDAGFEPINADILEDQARDEAAVEGINMDVDGELDKFLSNPDDMEADHLQRTTGSTVPVLVPVAPVLVARVGLPPSGGVETRRQLQERVGRASFRSHQRRCDHAVVKSAREARGHKKLQCK